MKEQRWLEEGWFFHNHAWHLLHEIIKHIPEDSESLLDVGAGTGIMAAVIKAVNPDIDVHVCDVENECFEFWEKRSLPGSLITGESLPFAQSSFDTIICSHVLEHVNKRTFFIHEMFSVARKRLIIVVPDGDQHFYDHKIVYDRANFLEAVQSAIQPGEYVIKDYYPLYHQHINNLIMIIDKVQK